MRSVIKSSALPALLAAIALAVTFSTGSSQPPQPAAKKTIFSTLKAGQIVTLYSKGSAWDVVTLDSIADAGSHRVVEIGDDFIALKDVVDGTEFRIPIFAIRAVTDVKMKE